jgi:hypothetical protein
MLSDGTDEAGVAPSAAVSGAPQTRQFIEPTGLTLLHPEHNNPGCSAIVGPAYTAEPHNLQ